MRHVRQTCISPRWNDAAKSNNDKMQANVADAGMKLIYGAA